MPAPQQPMSPHLEQQPVQRSVQQPVQQSARAQHAHAPKAASGADRARRGLRSALCWRVLVPGGRGSGVGEDTGSMAVELAVLAPAIGLLIGFVIAAGRLSVSQGVVQAAAVDAARLASISRTADAAQNGARAGAETSLSGQPNTCRSYEVAVNAAGFAVRVGVPAQVEVTVVCHVPLANLLPGLPGSKTITKTAISPLDTYRERT